MQCAVYKSIKKSDTYLFVAPDEEFTRVPQSLLDMLGNLEFVMNLDLDKRDKLAQSDLKQVKIALQDHGYYLQLPPKAYVSGSA
ncbi:YcgL domain-containing protein [Kaarinaea lacus]